MAAATTVKMPRTPKPWMNTAMAALLRTPGPRAVLGRAFALISVTGATTGKRYTTPVQYFRDGDAYVVMSQRHRTWWTNIRRRPDVDLVIAGRHLAGRARIAESDESRERIRRCLERNPRVARYYEIAVDEYGNVDPDGVEALSAAVAVIVIEV